MEQKSNEDTKLTITREFDAPRDLVFDAWIQKEHLVNWNCPKEMTVVVCEANPTVGGSWKSGMKSEEGNIYTMFGKYKEINKPEKLVLTHQWEREDGTISPETIVTILFEENNGKTTMHFEHVGFAGPDIRDSHNKGWTSAFEHLADHLKNSN